MSEASHEHYFQNLQSKYSSYQFYYKTNPTPEQLRRGPLWGVRRFSDLLINGRCTFNTQKGVRCGRRTVFGVGYCWQHLEDKRQLKIAPSLIKRPKMDRDGRVMHDMAGHVIRESIGKGVFAYDKDHAAGSQVFDKDDVIMNYVGEHITNNEASRRYGHHNNPYTIKGTQTVWNERTRREEIRNIRGAPLIDSALIRGVTALINHKPHQEANCRFSSEHSEREGWVYKIRANRPILNGEELYVDYGGAYGNFNSPSFPKFTTQSKYTKPPDWY